MKKFRIKCTTEDVFHPVIASDSGPTKCPVDDTHVVDTSLNSILEDDVDIFDPAAKELLLDEYKELRKKQINTKTDELLELGFVFDSNTFSLSPTVKIDWIGIKVMKTELVALGYFPYPIINMDGDTYLLEEVDVSNFLLTGMGTYANRIQSGGALKTQINNCTTAAELEAIEDNR